MTEVIVTDKNGCKLTLYDHEGLLYPYFPDINQMLESLQKFPVRHDDVLICGYPRSGTNWVWEVVTMLLSGKAENSKAAKIDYMLEYRDHEKLKSLASPRVLNTHVGLKYIPQQFIEKKCKMLYLIRNPKDVAVSMFNFTRNDLTAKYDGSWDGFVNLMLQGKVMYGCWFECIKEWEKIMQTRDDLDMFLLAYEDLKTNFRASVKRLANFLGVEHNDEFFEEVEQKCNFQNLKAAKDKTYDDEEKSFWRGGKPAYMRKGTVGDWKNWFTVAQNEDWDEKIATELNDSKWTFKYDLNDV